MHGQAQSVSCGRPRSGGNIVKARENAQRAIFLVRLCVISIFVFPPDMVVDAIGAVGYVAMLIGLLLFVLWVGSTLMGQHDPLQFRSPVRWALGVMWLATVVSYIAMPLEGLTFVQRAAADRWLLTLCGISGIVLVTSEGVRSLSSATVLVRSLVTAGTISSLVAVYQVVVGADPLEWVRMMMVGMQDNGGGTTFQDRGNFTRVAGSTFTPIELGVVSSMLLPLAIWRALFAPSALRWRGWAQAVLIALAAAMTVSRSAILGLAIIAVVLVPFLPPLARRWSSIIVPSAAVAAFVAVPGFVSTITGAFTAGTSDPSLSTRVNNYPRVEALVQQHPWTGQGPATYISTNALEILDNQYLHTLVEMGLIGFVAFLMLVAAPVFCAVHVGVSTADPAFRCLAGAVAASGTVALITSATFDSLSFPTFTIIFAVIAGLSGAIWMMAKGQPSDRVSSSDISDSAASSRRQPWIPSHS